MIHGHCRISKWVEFCPFAEYDDELAVARRRVRFPIAADESIRRAEDAVKVSVAGAADIAVIECTPRDGVRRCCLEVAAAARLPRAVCSALEPSFGLAAQLALAGALPR
jgi:O-succinylbenzoate synthase